MSKYKVTLNELERIGNCAKFERDKITREQISKALYRETAGATQQERTEIINKLYDRRDH